MSNEFNLGIAILYFGYGQTCTLPFFEKFFKEIIKDINNYLNLKRNEYPDHKECIVKISNIEDLKIPFKITDTETYIDIDEFKILFNNHITKK